MAVTPGMTHREAYPEQYTHPLVGKRVGQDGKSLGVVERVFRTRFGLLAKIEGQPSNTAFAVKRLKEE